jgi:hypothetical protein
MTFSDHPLGEFERALRQLRDQLVVDPSDATGVIREALTAIAASGLPEEERSRRAGRLTEALAHVPEASNALTENVRSAAPEVRAGVVAALAPELRARVYGQLRETPTEVQQPRPGPSDATPPPDDDTDAAAEAAGEWRTVLLLGDTQDLEVNERFLEEHDYRGIRVASERELVAVRNESYSAVVIHPSFWQGMPDGRTVTDVLGDQIRRASIPIYKIDSSGFGETAQEVLDLVDRLSPDVRQRIIVAEGSLLNHTDIANIGRYARLLESSSSANITIDGLSDRESRLLTTAASLFAANLRSKPVPARARDVSVAPLTDGRSGARVFRVLVQGSAVGFVAKFDETARLTAEYQTARLVTPVTQPLEIEIYALGGHAVLLQRLIPDNDEPLRAAPSFKERIEARGAWERGRDRDPEPVEADLMQGVARLVRMLKQIATQAAGDVEGQCWMQVEPLDKLAAQGVVYQIESDIGSFDPRDALPLVHGVVDPMSNDRLVHGDLHAGNVLMADDRTPLLIDFATAGAGHPLFDLVRFGSAVAFLALRPVAPEARMRDMLSRVHVVGDSASGVSGAFPDIVASGSAGLAVKALCAVRAAALELLPSGSGVEQYLAMTYLIAAQSLTMYEFQAAIVRATLGAIHPAIAATPTEAAA